MARIAYVDHSYHRTTQSTNFLREMLRRRGHQVHDFWDDAWKGGAPATWAEVKDYDAIIMFQSYCRPENGIAFRQVHPNVNYIPMLDQFGIWQGPMFDQSAFWAPFQGSKVLNFSSALHCLATGFGIASHWARYYQQAEPQRVQEVHGLRGFFWLRRQDQINWGLISRLIQNVSFDRIHIHLAQDPGSQPPEMPDEADIVKHSITTSTWFEDRGQLTDLVDQANVYFSPRMEEGIGQSFLEAMARGKCVVASNQGTMNEYILHGVNGLLYDNRAPRPLDFSNVAALGIQARASVVAGYEQWLAAEDGIVDFILTPSERLYVGKYQHEFPAPAIRDEATELNQEVPTVQRSLAPQTTLTSTLREQANRHAAFRLTRPLWHPLLRLARLVRQALQG